MAVEGGLKSDCHLRRDFGLAGRAKGWKKIRAAGAGPDISPRRFGFLLRKKTLESKHSCFARKRFFPSD